ncbi:hypothetical protein Q0M94_08870 [Deinococcus radiomollis]|uniref:hypothetical protein n=1 Tax=Deinococcus radiomollis TaxID=468916 RepID=UPI0038929297
MQNVWPQRQVSQALARAGFEPDFSSNSGFEVDPQSFYWNPERTKSLLISVRAEQVELHLLGVVEGQQVYPGKIPSLRLPPGAEALAVGLDTHALRLSTAVSAEALLDDLGTQIMAQDWQELGRLTADWGAFASFRQSGSSGPFRGQEPPRWLLTFTLTRSAGECWLVHLNSTLLPSPEAWSAPEAGWAD